MILRIGGSTCSKPYIVVRARPLGTITVLLHGHGSLILVEGSLVSSMYEQANGKGRKAKAAKIISWSIRADVVRKLDRDEPEPQEQAQRKKEALAARAEKQSRVQVLEAIRKKLPDVFYRPDLEMVALDYFRRLGHDNHRCMSKLYAWEENKSKTSWGAQTVDYEKIAAAAVQAMKTADLNGFLVVCALVSDLYCPGYNPRQSLEENSNLAQAASRGKVDTAKVATSVRAELSKAKNKVNEIGQPTKKSNTAKSPHPSGPKRQKPQAREATSLFRPLGRFSYHVRFCLCAKFPPNPLDCSPAAMNSQVLSSLILGSSPLDNQKEKGMLLLEAKG